MVDGLRRPALAAATGLAFVASALVAVPQPATAGTATAATGEVSWPQSRGGAGLTNSSAYAGSIPPATVAGLHLLRSAPTEAGLGAVVDGVNYTGVRAAQGSARFAAQSLATGQLLWSVAPCPTMTSGWGMPAVGPTAIWFGNGRYVTVLSRTTHRVLRCIDTGAYTSTKTTLSAATISGTAVFLARGAKVFGYDEATGARLWQVTLPVGQVWSGVAADAGTVFVGTQGAGGTVYALSAVDGHLLWTYHQKARVRFITVAAGRVFLSPMPAALDATTGQLLWMHGNQYMGDDTRGAATDGSRVYYVGGEGIGPLGGLLVTFDAATGRQLYAAPSVPSYEGEGQVTVAGGIVWMNDVVGDGLIYLADAATGRSLGSLVDPRYASYDYYFGEQPIFAGGVAYILEETPDGLMLDVWGL